MSEQARKAMLDAMADMAGDEDMADTVVGVPQDATLGLIQRIASRPNSAATLTNYIRNSANPRIVFEVVLKVCTGAVRQGFLNHFARHYGTEDDQKLITLADLLSEDDVHQLLSDAGLRRLLAKEDHVFRSVNADAFWIRHVEWFIRQKNFRRAWDELVKGRRGISDSPAIAVADRNMASRYGQDLYEQRYFQMSQKAIAVCTHRLYAEMVAQGIFVAIDEDDLQKFCSCPSFPGGNYDKSADWQQVEEFSLDYRNLRKVRLNETGIMFLRLALYFRQQRKDARRARREKAL